MQRAVDGEDRVGQKEREREKERVTRWRRVAVWRGADIERSGTAVLRSFEQHATSPAAHTHVRDKLSKEKTVFFSAVRTMQCHTRIGRGAL